MSPFPGPQATSDWQRANDYTRAGMQRLIVGAGHPEGWELGKLKLRQREMQALYEPASLLQGLCDLQPIEGAVRARQHEGEHPPAQSRAAC